MTDSSRSSNSRMFYKNYRTGICVDLPVNIFGMILWHVIIDNSTYILYIDTSSSDTSGDHDCMSTSLWIMTLLTHPTLNYQPWSLQKPDLDLLVICPHVMLSIWYWMVLDKVIHRENQQKLLYQQRSKFSYSHESFVELFRSTEFRIRAGVQKYKNVSSKEHLTIMKMLGLALKVKFKCQC